MPAISGHIELASLHAPPTTSDCLNVIFGFHCYQPFQLQKAYNLKPLFDRGFDGRGRTIVDAARFVPALAGSGDDGSDD